LPKRNIHIALHINFKTQKTFRQPFEGDLSVDALVALLSVLAPTFAFILGKTLLISMRFKGATVPGWRSNPLWKGRYDILATGPLLGVKGHRGRSGGSAIGFEHFLQMKPMDFDEFL